MAFVTADRVTDVSSTTGSGSITLANTPPTGYRSFASVLTTNDTFYYLIQSQTTGEWEVGVGTYSGGNVFARTTVLASSNSGSLVSFSVGVKTVFLTLAAVKTVQADKNDLATVTALGLTGSTGTLSLGNQTAVAGSTARQDWLFSNGNSSPNVGGYWPTSMGSYFTIQNTFSSSYVANDGEGPVASLWATAYANNSTKDTVGGMLMSIGTTANATVFGANIIATDNGVVNGVRHVGLEIDMEPSSGTTPNTGGGGLFINTFNQVNYGTALLISDAGTAGKWNNGITINGIASGGAAIADQAGLSCAYGLALTNASSYSNAAIYLGNLFNIRFAGTSGSTAANIYGNASNYWQVQLTSGALFDSNTTSQNQLISAFRNSAGTSAVQIFTTSGFSWNSAATGMTVGNNTSTSRSINASGTVNASGADYAEYEFKRHDCAAIAKGDIIGFDIDGNITDQWSLAVSFGVKSTSPNLVGGDVWHLVAGEVPIEPTYVPLDIKKPAHPGQSIRVKSDVTIEQHEAEMAQYETTLAAHRAEWDGTVYAAYLTSKVEYEQRLEIERQKVDRIAYCGKVPVNVTGANVGDYIVPVEQNGKIGGIAVSAPNFDQYMIAVGRVKKIMADGRPEIVVKPI